MVSHKIRNFLLAAFFIFVVSIFPFAASAAITSVGGVLQSGLDRLVGGQIITLVPCENGIWVTLGPPTTGSFMYVPGVSFSFPWGPPLRHGQWLLGLSTDAEVQCVLPVGVVGTGKLILFHGSSVSLI